MNEDDRNTRLPADDRLLFSTENGWVRHCVCRDVLVLHFSGHWMALTRPQYRDFHMRLISAVRCPIGQMQLNSGGRFAFRSGTNDPAFTLDLAGMEELLWLMDSARFMLEARDAAQRGFYESMNQDAKSQSDRKSREERREEP